MEELKIKHMTLGQMATNCYIIENGNQSLIVDPGAESEKIIQYLNENHLNISAILLTHGHFDHIGAVDDLVNKYQCSVYLHERDYNCFYDDDINLSNYSKPLNMQTKITLVKDFIECAGFKIQFLNFYNIN